jgi:hypothetical protein
VRFPWFALLISLHHSACLTALQVTGVLKMRTYLSGMPECKLGLNDKVCSNTGLCGAAAAAAE